MMHTEVVFPFITRGSLNCTKKYASLFALAAMLICALFIVCTAYADIPARIEVYARWEQVKSAVISHFSDAEAAALAKRLQKTIDAYSSVPLHDAYLQDPAFIGLGGSSDLLSGLVELVKSHLLKGESKRVMALFDALNKGKLVQGISVSRDYSGCLLVTFELAVTKEGIYEVSAFHAPYNIPACRPAPNNKGFKGVAFSMSTGVAVPPGVRSESGHSSMKVRHSAIVFIRKKALWTAYSDGSGARMVAPVDSETVSAISPDGQWIIYHAGSDPLTGFGRLYRVRASGGMPEPLTIKGFAGGQDPSFSPDGRSIVFVGMSDVRAKMKKGFDAVYATMSVAVFDLQTGSSRRIVTRKNVLLDAGYVFSHPSFSPDGRRIVYQHSGSDVSGGFSVIDLSGKTLFRFPKSASDPSPFWRPQFNPEGKQILCYSPATSEEQVDTIYMIHLETGAKRRIAEGAAPAFVESGKAIVFMRWIDQWNSSGNAGSDLWYLELEEGALPKKILNDGSYPSGVI